MAALISYPEEYSPAYRYGWESRSRHTGQNWTDVEADLARGWRAARAQSRLEWDDAKPATRDAWDRIETTMCSRVEKH